MIKRLLKKYSHVFPAGSVQSDIKKILVHRRRRLLKALDSFAVFSAVTQEPGEENLWFINGVRIFQEPSVLYLTGINQAKVILVLNPFGPEQEVLF